MESVKSFVRHCSTSKTSLRKKLLEDLCASAQSGDLPAPAVKLTIQALGSTLFRYGDRGSKAAVENAFELLCSVYGSAALQPLSDVLEESCRYFKASGGSCSLAKSALTLLRWSCIAFSHSVEVSSYLLRCQSTLLACISCAPNRKPWLSAVHRLNRLWHSREGLAGKCLDCLLSGTEPYLPSLCLLGLLSEYCRRKGEKLEISKQVILHSLQLAAVEALLVHFSKVVLASRTKPQQSIVATCVPIFKRTSHIQFSSLLLPSTLKCLLRNPDELLEAVAFMVSALPIDCSQYAVDILKNTTPHLSSNQPPTRRHALSLVTALAKQCSDPGPVTSMLEQLLAALMSSPSGKLTVAEHRCSILAALETLTKCPLSVGSQQQLATATTEGLITYTKQEVHTATAEVAVNVLRRWCPLLPDTPPTSLVDHIKGGLAGKNTPPVLRVAYLHCVMELCTGERSQLLPIFHPAVMQSLERASGSSPQAASLEEALVACHLLMSTSDEGALPPQLWSLVDSDHLTSSKLASTASQESLQIFIHVAERVLCSDTHQLKPQVQREWLCAVVEVMMQGLWTMQQAGARCLSRAVERSPTLAMVLLGELEKRVKKDEFRPRPVLLALQSLATPTHPHREEVAVQSLLIAHHPIIAAICPHAWGSVLQKLSFPPHSLISQRANELLTTILGGVESQPQACRSAISSLVSFGAALFLPKVVEQVCALLGQQEVLQVTGEQLEVMHTPPGQLWHKGMMHELEVGLSGDLDANMKRESKAYSFEDQKWEAQMRLDRQKKMQGVRRNKDVRTLLKEAKLSQKQHEAIVAQLDQEEEARKQLSRLDQRLADIVFVVRSLRGELLVEHTPRLSKAVLNALPSPLATTHCAQLWGVIVHSVFKEWNLAQLFSEVSLHTLLPLTPSPSPTLLKLLSAMEQYHPPNPTLSSAAHVLSLPLLHTILIKMDAGSELRSSAVAALCRATHSYTPTEGEDTPQLFPVADTLRLLSTLISSGENTARDHRLRKSCIAAFIALCRSLSDLRADVLNILTTSLLDPCPDLRNTVLTALGPPHHLPPSPQLQVALLITRHDSEDGNRMLAEKLWESCSYSPSRDLGSLLISHASSSNTSMQDATAQALAVWLESNHDEATNTLNKIMVTFRSKKATPPPQKDAFGRMIVSKFRDPWESRVGVAKAMEQLPKFVDAPCSMDLLKFVIPGALSDLSGDVQSAVMAAAMAAISAHGETLAGELMSHCEHCMQLAADTHEADTIRQSIVVLMGTLAKHMDKENPKVKTVVHLLLSNLDTPSQQVQEAIANCLPPLASVIKSDAENIINKLLDKLLNSTSYSQRRGAAYGLAGLVKGLGIPTLKQFKVMPTLQEAIRDKKNYRHREGALFAFESLCNILGRLFEPYVVHLLPDLLLCFGDGNQYVREATDQTARTIMAHLSSHGVKLILPSLLSALEEDSWRTKAGSAELLGAMAYCAPKQLSSCLPSIVPRLMEVLADSHSKVHMSGSQALKQIGSVIKNPEIQALVPVLLDALADPSNKAQVCLQALLDTEFIHVIDPPSLALIMPTLKRTLELRSTDAKKMAAQIIGNMYTLTDKKDLAPYLPDVLPGLKQSLVDPVPEVRSVCAKALGAMVRGMGDEGLAELLPWLLATLQSESSSVDRSGAAQGLSEVLVAQGVNHLQQLMPQFIDSSQDPDNPTHVRDGYLMLFVYLPVAFKDDFSPFISSVLPCILKGWADESEFIRETSLQAGQTIVNRYADTAMELFLPELENGLFNENWRIRCSSVQLLGDLLYKISGLSGKMSTESEEDDNFGTEEARQAILKNLGMERRNRVLSGLYMGRSDVALMVRQAALHVWKVVVTNTARTLREILPILISLILGCLASESYDKRKVAARTLGDLVRKLGERVLPEVIPMLEQGLNSPETQKRQGVCIGLSEIIRQTSRDSVLLYVDSLLPTVRNALCDAESDVRAAAAQTFDSLHSTVGPRILDEVLSPLLADLSLEDRSEIVLDGLKQVMAVKSSVVLPHIIPQLVQPPVNAKALALLSSVAGEALHKHLGRIIHAVISSLRSTSDEDTWAAAEGVVLSVQKAPGPSILIEELCKAAQSKEPDTRAAAMALLYSLCSHSTADLMEHIPQLLIFTTERLNDPSDAVCEKAWLALEATVKRVNQKELPHFTGYLRKALRTVSSNLIGNELHGFTLRGIGPVLTLLKEGLMSGSPDEKEEAARVLVDVIHLSAPKTLSTGKVVMLIAGPLIRVLGDRYSWNVKVATLEALVELVRKVGVAAKSFIPQLQTSYLKALNDPNRPVRVQATTGLIELLPLSPRVDPVFNDLHNGVKRSEDLGLRLTMLQALCGVIKVGGQRMSEKHRGEILATLVALQTTAQEGNRLQAAECIGALCAYLGDQELRAVMTESLLELEGVSDWAVLQARAAALSAALHSASARIVDLGMRGEVASAIVSLASSDRVPVCVSGLQGVGSFINHMEGDSSEMIPPLSQGLSHGSNDIRIVACEVCGGISSPSDQLLAAVLPPLLQNSREKNSAVRASAEKAVVDLVNGDERVKHCMGLLDGPTARKLEDTYQRAQARLSRDS